MPSRSKPVNVGLLQVAQSAGVSLSTASRAINGHAKQYRISEKTVRRVLQKAEQLNYQPSHIARSLRTQKSGLIGVAVPDISNPFFSAIAREITLAMDQNGYSVLLADSRESTENEIELTRQFLSRRVEALVVCPVGTHFQHLETIDRSGTPVIVVDRCSSASKLVQLTSHHVDGAAKATRLLVQSGHRTIGLLQGLPGTMPNTDRLHGVRQELKRAGIPFDEQLISGDNFTEDSGFASAHRLLRERTDLTALFAFSTPNALGALRAIESLGLSVPTDISLVAFDDSPFAEFMRVPLTTVAQDISTLGRQAAKMVATQLANNDKVQPKINRVPVRIICRESVSVAKNSSLDGGR